MLNTWISRLILVATGGLFPLSMAPVFWWPLGLLSIAVLAWFLLHATTPRQAFGSAWWYGLGKFGAGVSWVYVSMNQFGGTSAPLAVLMVFVFAGGLALLPALWFFIRHKCFGQHLFWLSFPAIWFLAEWSRSWLMTGFPWLYAGDGHLYSWLSGWIPIIGSLGISWLLALTASLVLMAILRRSVLYLAGLLLWPIGLLLQPIAWTNTSGELTVSAVQGNIPQNVKWAPEMLNTTVQIYTDETDTLWQSDLILWPETAIPMLLEQFQPYLDTLSALATQHQTGLMTGIVYRHPEGHPLAGEYHNSIVSAGLAAGLYHKQKLVPFGEFVPFEEQIRGLIPFFNLEMSSFLSGPPNQPLLTVEKQGTQHHLAPYICYEIAYPLLVADMAKHSEMLITVSNDAWFGDSLGPKQHMALAQLRARETGRYLLRSTNTGITALVDHMGHIVAQLPAGKRASLTGKALLKQGQTPFMMFGLFPVIILCGITLLIAFWSGLRQQTTHSPEYING